MKEAIGTQTTFKIIIAFTLLFAGFITVALTYNKTFRIKNELINIIEKYEGVNNKSLTIMNNYLSQNGYATKNSCADEEFGVANLDSPSYEKAQNRQTYYYCLSSYVKNGKLFYKVHVFSRFNLPFIGDLLKIRINGETKGIKIYSEEQMLR